MSRSSIPQIRQLLEIVRKEDLGLTVETNGVLCTPELAQELRSCKNTFVSVSLDGADAADARVDAGRCGVV